VLLFNKIKYSIELQSNYIYIIIPMSLLATFYSMKAWALFVKR
jgi:hypothetical protein